MEILSETQSICPRCEKPVRAQYVLRDGSIYLEKNCREHGTFRALIARNEEDYREWIKNPVINIAPKAPITKGAPGDDECPLHCGTCENHLQTACCIVLDITDRCNQHCPYCFARADEDAQSAAEPSLAELSAKFDLLLELGEERPFNIQLSGGEPTVRDDLPEIIEMAKNKGFEYIQINSNGRRLATEDGYARKLKRAGASVIFMQFDGTRDDIYLALRGEPLLEIKKKAIENCRKAGLPVTLVPTIVKNVNLDNIGEMMEFLLDRVEVVKGIHFQPVSFFGRCPEQTEISGTECAGAPDGAGASGEDGQPVHEDFENRVTMFDVLRELEKQSPAFSRKDFSPIATGHTLCCFYSTYLKEGKDRVKCLVSQKSREEGISCCDAAGAGCCEPDPLEIIRKDRDYVLNKWDLPEEPESCCCGASAPETDSRSCCCEVEPAAPSCCCGEPEPAETQCCTENRAAENTESCCCASSEGEAASAVQTGESCCCGETSEPETESAGCCEAEPAASSCCCGAEDSREESCGCEPEKESESCCCGAETDEPMDLDEFLTYYKRNTFTVTGMAFQDAVNLDAERLKRCRVQVMTEDNRLVPFCGYNSIYRGEQR